jgi:SAM-dependent methyltransferase
MGTAARSQARYDEWADWYEHYITSDAQNFTQRTAEILAQVLGSGAGLLLDLACGTGIHGQTLSALGWTPFGVDLSAGQLRHARGRMPVAVAEASALPVRTGTLAAVTAVLCHTDIDDYALTCQAVSRALQGGGVFAHVGVHPCFVGAFADRTNSPEITITPGYWERDRRFEGPWRGVRARVGARHIPLGELLETFLRAGLTIERVIEAGNPTPDILAVRCRRRSPCH